MKKRTAKVKRKTKETDISVDVNLDGKGVYSVSTGISFLDHMLDLFSKHSMIDLRVRARGDLDVDYHHTVEDLGLALGDAIDRALSDRRGIRRYGSSYVPMDEALARVVVDLGGRPYLIFRLACRKKKVLRFDTALFEEFFRGLTVRARMNLHIDQMYGNEPHHACEAVFKAFGRALRSAVEADSRGKGIPSTKGSL